MLSITTKSPYALKALTELGRQGGDSPVPIGELARRRDIPVQFLEQLFAVLRRGPRGAGQDHGGRHRRARQARGGRGHVLHLRTPPARSGIWLARAKSAAEEPLSTAGIGTRAATRLLRTRGCGIARNCSLSP